MKNTAQIDLNDRNITNARFIQVNQLPPIDSQLTAKLYVDNAIGESSLVRNIQDNDFNNNNLTNIISINLNTQAVNDNQSVTKAYVDRFHNDNERTRRDLNIDFYDESSDLVKNNQDKDLNDNKVTNLDSIKTNRDPASDNELANKNYVDNELDENTILRFNKTLENYLEVSVGNDRYNLTKYDKIQITDNTIIETGYSGSGVLPNWNIICNDKNGNGKLSKFIKSRKTNSPTEDSGAISLPPIGNSFMYIETSSNNHRASVFVSLEWTDIQITNTTFYYKRFSYLTNDNLKSING